MDIRDIPRGDGEDSDGGRLGQPESYLVSTSFIVINILPPIGSQQF